MKNKLRSPLVLLLIAASVALAAFAVYRQFNKLPPEQQYRLQAVEKGDISQTVSANGTINPVTLVNVGTQVSGTVKKLYVDFNSEVEKGQVLLELDDALLAAQQRQSQASVQSANAMLDLATANEVRTRSLYVQEYASRLELDTAVQARKSAEAQLQLALATVAKDKANLAYSVIRSPVSGVVVDRTVDVGQTVAASLQTPTLFKIAQDLSRMQIDANFAEADIGSIRDGQSVHFTVDAFPNQSFQGEVKRIRLNPTSLQNVVTYDVVINVNNPKLILLPGMTAYVSIAVAERKQALLVPNAALRFKSVNDEKTKITNNQKDNRESSRQLLEGGASDASPQEGYAGKVYVLKNSELLPVTVRLGITDNRNTEIISGKLNEGDQLVTGGSQTSNDGQSSSPQPMRMRMF